MLQAVLVKLKINKIVVPKEELKKMFEMKTIIKICGKMMKNSIKGGKEL